MSEASRPIDVDPVPSATTLVAALERSTNHPSTGLSILDRRERGHRRSWQTVHERSSRVATGLRRLGIRRGDRVALVFPTGFEFVEAFFGCLLIDAVPAALYPPVRLGRLDEYHRRTAAMISSIGAELILCDRRVHRILGETVARVQPSRGLHLLTEFENESAAAGGHKPDTDDLCLIQFSSGTTVEPKPIGLDHRAVMAQIAALNGFWPDTHEVRHSGVSWLPLYHDMGLIGCLFAAVERPGNLTLIPPELFVSRPAVWLRTISATRASISPAPNFAYGLCVERIRDDELEGVDLSSWRVALNGAETIVPAVARAFCERFRPWGFDKEALTPVYGLSEAALAVTFSDIHRPFKSLKVSRQHLASHGVATDDSEGLELVSVGRPLPGCRLSLRDENGNFVGENQTGRLWVKSPSLMRGYFGNRSASEATIVNGWLDTGDLGFMRDGELYLTGRAKDVLILRGRNHLPEDVELAIDRVEGARIGCSAAVSHLGDDDVGETLIVFVERSRKRGVTDDRNLAAMCREAVLSHTGLDATHVEILAPGTLPRTSSGKIRRQETLRLYLAGRLQAPVAFTPLRALKAMARSRSALRRARRQSADGSHS